MSLTGWPDAPGLGPPDGLVDRLASVGDRLAETTAAVGRPLRLDPLAVLTERAALVGLSRGGTVSCGRGTRLLAARDGWLAVSLARADDLDLVPAWLGHGGELDTPGAGAGAAVPLDDAAWDVVARRVAVRSVADLEAQAVLLGLPVGVLASPAVPAALASPTGSGPFLDLPVSATSLGPAPARRLDGLLVVDLSSLWAGPLCGRILADAGATVVKVESISRPDGARLGPAAFFDLLNAGKASVRVDLGHPAGVRSLVDLLGRADLVIEGSRPRALEQLGIRADALVEAGPAVWVSITGHGRHGPARNRVAFGDDAAIAGGLAAWRDGRPCFCADAVADPATGLVAAAAALTALAAGGRWLVDVAMVDVAAHLAGPTLDAGDARPVAPPRPADRGRARPSGADDARFLAPAEIARP